MSLGRLQHLNARWGTYHINRARECFSCTLYSTVDKVPSTFLLGRSLFVKESTQRISSVYKSRRDYQDHSNHTFHSLIPCSIALHLFLVRLLLNTRLYKAIGACTIVYDTDLQRGRAVTSLFRDVTIELYARFQSLSLYYLCSHAHTSQYCITSCQRASIYIVSI